MSRTTDSWKKRFASFWWGDQGLTAFLLFLFAAIFLAPFFESHLVRSITTIFISLLLISGVAYLSPRPLVRWIAGAFVLITIALNWLQEFRPNRELAIAASLFTVICLITLTLEVLARVFLDKGAINSARVRGAVAAYLLFGITWSVIYRLLNLWLPDAFTISAGMAPEQQNENFAYFSFVTLTTLGYGDITAIHPIARMFAIFEALVGQLYPATLLARLISLELTQGQAVLPAADPTADLGGATSPDQTDSNVPGGES